MQPALTQDQLDSKCTTNIEFVLSMLLTMGICVFQRHLGWGINHWCCHYFQLLKFHQGWLQSNTAMTDFRLCALVSGHNRRWYLIEAWIGGHGCHGPWTLVRKLTTWFLIQWLNGGRPLLKRLLPASLTIKDPCSKRRLQARLVWFLGEGHYLFKFFIGYGCPIQTFVLPNIQLNMTDYQIYHYRFSGLTSFYEAIQPHLLSPLYVR